MGLLRRRRDEHYGQPWPIHYRDDEATRLATLRALGVRAIPALAYPHKAGMAAWLNDWCADFAGRSTGRCTAPPSSPSRGGGAGRRSLESGARLFKMHVQVGGFSPDDPLLDPAWEALERAGAPVVLHAGSAPKEGAYTGPKAVAAVLERHPS